MLTPITDQSLAYYVLPKTSQLFSKNWNNYSSFESKNFCEWIFNPYSSHLILNFLLQNRSSITDDELKKKIINIVSPSIYS